MAVVATLDIDSTTVFPTGLNTRHHLQIAYRVGVSHYLGQRLQHFHVPRQASICIEFHTRPVTISSHLSISKDYGIHNTLTLLPFRSPGRNHGKRKEAE